MHASAGSAAEQAGGTGPPGPGGPTGSAGPVGATGPTGPAGDRAVTRRRQRRASAAVYAVFGANGLLFASWASRLPAVRDDLSLSTGTVGLVLLALSTGAVIALPTAGVVVRRLGPARTVLGAGLVGTAGVAGVGLAPSTAALVAVLLVAGLAMGTWDVAMNVEAAAVERALGATIMPRYHGAFSLGTVAGAGLGAAAAASGVGRGSHLVAVALAVAVIVVVASRGFLPGHGPAPTGSRRRDFTLRDAWREPRTLLVGVMALGFALVEGVANDWLALTVVDTRGAENWVGAAVFGVFLAGMTTGRLLGSQIVDALGRRRAMLATGLLAAAGGLTVATVPTVAGAVVGALLWGVGASLGFPVAIAAVAEDGDRASLRVSVVSSIGYTAFLAGPPLVGLIGDRAGLAVALLVVPAAAALAVSASRALPDGRQPQPTATVGVRPPGA